MDKDDLETLIAVDPTTASGTRSLSGSELNADKERVAQFCAQEIRREARRLAQEVAPYAELIPDDKPLNALELHNAAVAMTLKMITAMEQGEHGQENEPSALPEGAYIGEDEAPGLVATMFLRQGLGKQRRRKVMKHELAHHIQRTRVAEAIYDAETVTCDEAEGSQIRHEIARRTEDLV